MRAFGTTQSARGRIKLSGGPWFVVKITKILFMFQINIMRLTKAGHSKVNKLLV